MTRIKIKIVNGANYFFRVTDDEQDVMIAVATDELQDEDKRMVELGSESIPVIEKFVSDVNSGTFKPKAAVKELENILEKHST